MTGLALLASQLRGLLEKRATYAVRRSLTVINVDNDDDDDDDDDDNHGDDDDAHKCFVPGGFSSQ